MKRVSIKKKTEAAYPETEEWFRSIYENSTIGIYRTTPEGHILLANPALVRMLGYSKFEDISKRNLEREGFEPNYDRSKFLGLMEKNDEVIGLESSWKKKDGVHIYIMESARAFRDADNKILYFDGSVEDITEHRKTELELEGKTKELQNELEKKRKAEIELQKSHKKLEFSKLATLNLLEDIKEEMQQRKLAEDELSDLNEELERRVTERTAQLEAANDELQAFAYSVSHDLRAPLRAIDGFSKFIVEDYGPMLDDEGRRLLGLIRTNTQKMDQLIVDILALSRVTRSVHRISEVDMTKLVVSMLNEAASPEVQSKINIVIDPLHNAQADPSYIKQVWINLISNAIKFSSLNEKPEIKIGGFIENDSYVYYVKDNGVGFNPEYGHKLYGVFQRLHRADEFDGTGVGLAIVKRIVLRHGGKVWAESVEGKGATFYFSIPVKPKTMA